MRNPIVGVEASAPGLARALQASLRASGLRLTMEGAGPPDVVVIPSPDCSPDRCREILAGGCAVIVLAPVPRTADQERYARAGAEYLPMTLDTTVLPNAIFRVAGPAGVR